MDTPTLTDLKRKPAHPLTFAMDIETKTHPSMNSTRLNDSQKRLLPASLGLAFFIFSFSNACVGQEHQRLPGPENPTELDRFILDGMKEAKLPGLAAAVVKNGKILWTGAYGWANREQKVPVTNDTLFFRWPRYRNP